MLDYFDMADFLQKLDLFHQPENYFTIMEGAECFWQQFEVFFDFLTSENIGVLSKLGVAIKVLSKCLQMLKISALSNITPRRYRRRKTRGTNKEYSKSDFKVTEPSCLPIEKKAFS
jgi:hypothetical protein